MIARLFAFFLCLSLATAGPAQRVVSLPLATPWLGLPQIPVTLNGNVEGQFIVDTAASDTVLTDTMISRLGLTGQGAPAELAGATGNSSIHFYELTSIRLGPREYRALEAYSFPQLAAPVEADGLIGADILRRHVVEFDLPGQRLRLFDRHANFVRASGRWAVIPFYERADGLLLVPVSIGRVTMPALLDTGAVQNIVNHEAARRLGLRLFPDSDSREPITGASGHVQNMNQIEVSRFAVGDLAFGASRVGITDLAVFDTLDIGDGPAMLLSAQAFGDRRFIIDYPRNRLLIAREPG
ncbi:MAG: aspartyl protease family protein [Pseudomonadota bacterium]